MPVFRAVTIIPIASEEAETTAIAASLLTFARSVMRSRKKAAIATIGMENFSGAQPNANATDKAPKETCDNPSPIIENRFRTRLTPKRAAQRETKIPTSKARRIKANESISMRNVILFSSLSGCCGMAVSFGSIIGVCFLSKVQDVFGVIDCPFHVMRDHDNGDGFCAVEVL